MKKVNKILIKKAAKEQIEEDKDLMLIADNGLVIRLPLDTVNVLSRTAQGVKVMKLRAGTKIVGITFVDKEENEQPAEEINVEETQTEQPNE